MSKATYAEAMTRVFADEGGYCNDAADPGGPTNWGITIYDVRKYVKADATATDVKLLTRDQASLIYSKHYAEPVCYDQQPDGVDYAVLDGQINSGRGLKWEAQALGKDGKPIELAVAAWAVPDKVALIKKIYGARSNFLHNLKTFDVFGKGWMRRVTGGEAAAVAMWLRAAAVPVAPVAKKESDDAKSAAVKQGTGAGVGTAGAGSTTQVDTGSIDFTHRGAVIAFGVVLGIAAAVLIYRAIINRQRSKAYAAVAVAHA